MRLYSNLIKTCGPFLWSSAESVVSSYLVRNWVLGSKTSKIQSFWVLLYLVLFVRLSGTDIPYFRWCLTVPENTSLKSFAFAIFNFSTYSCELTVLRKGALPLIQFLSYKASPLNCFGNGLMYYLQCEEAGGEKDRWLNHSINTDLGRQFGHILLRLPASTLCT